jgi:hypothetical protein
MRSEHRAKIHDLADAD